MSIVRTRKLLTLTTTYAIPIGVGASHATPVGGDWFVVDWLDVWNRKRLRPSEVPGVVQVSGGVPDGAFPYRVHATHLAVLGYEPASRVSARLPPTNGVSLHPHQVEGISFIRSRRGTLLADEQRVGKSPQIMYSHEPEAGPLIIVGPLAARAVWHEWAARRFGSCSVSWLEGSGVCSICERAKANGESDYPGFVALAGRKLDPAQLAAAKRARVIFMHFAIVPTWRQIFSEVSRVGTFAVDECHLSGIKNRKGVFFESIRFLNTVADRVIFASGTPLLNKPDGLWPMLDVLTPGAFGDFWTFARRYCEAKPTAYGWQAKGASNQEELRERLREVMIRRTWREIAPSLPPVTRTLEIVRLDQSTRDQVMETAGRIRKAQGGPKTVIGDLARLRRLYAEEKQRAAQEWVKATIAEGKSCVVWTWHRDIADMICNGLRGGYGVEACYGPIHGDMDPSERERVIEWAREASASRPVVLVATMAALGTAVNLSFAPHELTAELDWNPHVIAQAEMRPFDGINRVTNTILVADCDVEQRLADSLLQKLALNDQLGLAAGVGDVSSVLRESLGVDDIQTLSALADAVFAEAA